MSGTREQGEGVRLQRGSLCMAGALLGAVLTQAAASGPATAPAPDNPPRGATGTASAWVPAVPAPGNAGRTVIARSSAAPPPPTPTVTPVAAGGLRLQPPPPLQVAAPAGNVLPVAAFTPSPPESVPPPLTAPTPAAPAGTAETAKKEPGPSPATGLMLEKIGPASHRVGQPFTYEIVVRNGSSAPMSAVRIQDELPAGARCLGCQPPAETQGPGLQWELGNLEAGAERRIKVEVQPGGEGDFLGTATATFSTTSTMRTRITRSHLALSKSGPASAQVGDTVTFQIVVTNDGTGPATNVVIHDRLPAGMQHPQGADVEADVGTLAPGESKSIALPVQIIKGGAQVNAVVATADGGLQATAEATVQVTEGALLLRKTGPQQTVLHREFEHRLEVVNPGQAPATNVRLIDTLPEGLDFVSASDGGTYAAMSRTVEWSIGTVAAGQSRAVTLQLHPRAGGDLLNQAVARADRGLEAKAGAAIHVEGIPALLLEVVDLDDPVEVGAETTYEIRVLNQGTGTCTNVQIQATVPDGMEPIGAEGPSAHRQQGKRIVFAPVPKLAGRADALYRVRVRARKEGDWRFKVHMSCDQLLRPVYEEESTNVYDGGAIEKLEASPGVPPAKGGGTGTKQ